MGVASIKQLPCPSKIVSFSGKLNEEAILKVSFKNIDWFQIWKNYFFQKGPKNKQILKFLKFFFAHFIAFDTRIWPYKFQISVNIAVKVAALKIDRNSPQKMFTFFCKNFARNIHRNLKLEKSLCQKP